VGNDKGGAVSQKILVIDGDPARGLGYRRTLADVGHDVRTCDDPAAAVREAVAGGFDVILLGQTSSECNTLEILRQVKAARVPASVLIVSRDAAVEAAVALMKEGTADYLRDPCSAEELHAALQRMEKRSQPAADRRATEEDSWRPHDFHGMLGKCPAMRDVFSLIRRIAPSDSTVLVSGESGTGKEMVVRAIHRLSRRRDFPLLACDCTALAPTLLESELFGHVKGSFSGAIATKQGLFEIAHHGTLFLDEVANLSQETQGKLLRVLETRRVRKVGDTVEHEVDIRLVAATNRSLVEMVKVGAFRADLYYRLNVVPMSLPPLRERAEDIPLLTAAFLEHFSRELGVTGQGFSPEALSQLDIYPWPGNVRELRNIVERLAVLYGGSRIELHHLPAELRTARAAGAPAQVPLAWEELKRLKREIVDDLERRFLIEALDRCGQNITQAAEEVGMQRTNFHALLRRHGLKTEGKPNER
jgi:DNA-binding NtrC family response regulator